MMDEALKELYRGRWRRARETLRIVDPGQNGFARSLPGRESTERLGGQR
jgi:hypothetical protein